jgi:hypothetical protein
MMMSGSSLPFHWREPRGFRRARRIQANARLYRWQVAAGISIFVGLGILIWGFANGGPNINPAQERLMILGVVLVGSGILFFLPWLQEVIPFKIIVTEHSLTRRFGLFVPFGIRFSKVQHYDVRELSDHRMLVFDLRDKRRLLFGVPIQFELATLEMYFVGIGLTRRPSTKKNQYLP